MARPSRAAASQIAKLEQRVAELRRERVPDVIVIPVFADDAADAVQSYVTNLHARVVRVSPGPVVVTVTHLGARPAELAAPWATKRGEPVASDPPPDLSRL